ncbi:hypothetical protein AX17_000875 [Amanita inopinata Kibby_2008]|nr:hypothetical protein AX17_000875 [Amanita inopinata Kibby_2008]
MSKPTQPHLSIDLPVGSRLGWEHENTVENDALHSVADSAVLLHSLRQSRERWLNSIFPKFSSKARPSKSSEVPPPTPPPPHTIQTRGCCDLEIGPHVFPDTTFYEVHYLSTQPQATPSNVAPYKTTWQATSPYSTSYAQSTLAPSTSVLQPPTTTTSSASLTVTATITPALINQVNSAASSNPILANLLQLAAAGRASSDQLKTLGLLIQSLASPDPAAIASGAVSQSQASNTLSSSLLVTQPPVKLFDLVIEFREMPNQRWLFPRGPNVCERVLDSNAIEIGYDVIITTCIPFEKNVAEKISDVQEEPISDTPKPPEKTPQAIKFCLKKAPLAVWDTLHRWAGNEQEMNKHREYLQSLNGPDRVYLGYQLLPGTLLTQLQVAAANAHPMKLIKPGLYASRSKKRTARRRGSEHPVKQAGDDTSSAKQRRRSQTKKNTSLQILCLSCGKTDVPLILGGRYCRPCVEAGKANATGAQSQDTAGQSQMPLQVEPMKPPVFIHSSYSSQA